MILTKEIIFSNIADCKNNLIHYGVKRIGLFGSAVKGTSNSSSDIDLLVAFEEGKKNFDNYMDLCFFLEDLFHKKVDLITEDSLDGELKSYIFDEVQFVEVR